jgi:hypothetical protein
MKVSGLLWLLICIIGSLTACRDDDDHQPDCYDPKINPNNFVTVIDNPYFSLEPGKTFHYQNKVIEDSNEGQVTTIETVDVTVTSQTKEIMGVTCVVVHDVSKEGSTVLEDTYDWYAQDKQGNVWYFGEDTKSYEDGQVSTEGSWTAGVDGAKPGIVMHAHPEQQIGKPYYQEYYEGHAEDQAIVLDTKSNAKVAYGSFENCIRTKDFTRLEPDVVENKYYAKGVGLVLAVRVKGGNEREELMSITP